MKKQAFNPYLPSWEYIPDGEPYVFDGRVYVYGSHDFWNGYVFCMGDYVCWSAPVDDLGNWRYEGVIYPRNADPLNKEGKMCLYAPDVTVGPDGRYYLYYVLDKVGVISVAVCDTPAGKYEFYGYVVVSPTFPDSLEDLKYLKTNKKFRGIKIHPDYHGYDLSVPSNFAFVDKVLKKTPMALFHCSCMPGSGKSPFATIVELARRNPKTKVVAAHGAGLFQNGNYPFFPNLDSLERETAKGLPKNLWVDTAHYLLYCYPTILQKMVDLAGADHVVYGTDAPLQGPMQMRFMAELVDSLDNPQSDKDKIFYKNAEKILGVKI